MFSQSTNRLEKSSIRFFYAQVISPDQHVPHYSISKNDLNGDVLQQFNLWPNPANASVNLSFESSIEHDVQFTLTNYLGQVVVSDDFEAMEGFNSRKIDGSQLANGSYLMQLISETETRTKMLVIFGK